MTRNLSARRFLPSLILLGLVTFATFAVLVTGREYVFDDLTFVLSNPHLAHVKNFADIFHYSGQATKPVFNLSLAFSHWLTHGSVVAQRALTLFLHLSVVILFYLAMCQWCADRPDLRRVPFWAALLFAIHPVHTETLAVVQFRGEILGALFALIAVRRAPAFAVALSLCAILSKEVYLVVIPALMLSTMIPRETGKKAIAWISAGGAAILMILFLVDQKQSARFSYTGNVGFQWAAILAQVQQSGRALVEGLSKWFSGGGLTTIRLSARSSIADVVPSILLSLLTLAWLTLGIWCFRRGGLVRVLSALLFPASLFYLLVPNANVGSEHYLYFATMGAAGFTALAILRMGRSGEALLVGLAVLLFMQTQSRSFDYRDRMTLAKAELTAHPESAPAWAGVAANLMQRSAPPDEIEKYVDVATKIDPNLPNLPALHFMNAYHLKDCGRMRSWFPRVESSEIFEETKEKIRLAYRECHS